MKAIAVMLLAASFACPAYRAERHAYLREVHLVATLRHRLALERRHRAPRRKWSEFAGPNPILAKGRGVSYGWGAI